MPGFLVSEHFYSSPEALRAGNAALGLWVCAGSWCAKNEPAGFVPDDFVETCLDGRRLAERLVDAGLWEAAERGWWFAFTLRYDLWWIDRQQYRRKIPADVRAAVLDRDGHVCLRCGSTDDLTVDHVFPWSLGGSDEPTNLQILCMPCNRAKGATVDA